MIFLRRGLVALVFLIFLNRLNHLAGADIIAPGDDGYKFGDTTGSVVTHGYYLIASLFWMVMSAVALTICLFFEPPHFRRPGFIILGGIVAIFFLIIAL